MTDPVLAENYKNTPYWWERTPRPVIKEILTGGSERPALLLKKLNCRKKRKSR